jgi:hypothetical protein
MIKKIIDEAFTADERAVNVFDHENRPEKRK